jgi:hypothetical protein
MGPVGRSAEPLEILAAMARNVTLVLADKIDFQDAQIECLCLVSLQPDYLMLPDCHPGVDVSNTANI